MKTSLELCSSALPRSVEERSVAQSNFMKSVEYLARSPAFANVVFPVSVSYSVAMGAAPSAETGEPESSNAVQLGPEPLQIDMTDLRACVDCKVGE